MIYYRSQKGWPSEEGELEEEETVGEAMFLCIWVKSSCYSPNFIEQTAHCDLTSRADGVGVCASVAPPTFGFGAGVAGLGCVLPHGMVLAKARSPISGAILVCCRGIPNTPPPSIELRKTETGTLCSGLVNSGLLVIYFTAWLLAGLAFFFGCEPVTCGL